MVKISTTFLSMSKRDVSPCPAIHVRTPFKKCRVTSYVVQRDSSAIKFDSLNRIYLSFILSAEPLTDETELNEQLLSQRGSTSFYQSRPFPVIHRHVVRK